MSDLTKKEIQEYSLVCKNGDYYSKQGLIFQKGDDKKQYLSKVFKMNETDKVFENLKKKYDNISRNRQ